MSEAESPVSEAMTMFLCKRVIIMRWQSLWTKRQADAVETGAPPLFEFHEQLQKGSAKRCSCCPWLLLLSRIRRMMTRRRYKSTLQVKEMAAPLVSVSHNQMLWTEKMTFLRENQTLPFSPLRQLLSTAIATDSIKQLRFSRDESSLCVVHLTYSA